MLCKLKIRFEADWSKDVIHRTLLALEQCTAQHLARNGQQRDTLPVVTVPKVSIVGQRHDDPTPPVCRNIRALPDQIKKVGETVHNNLLTFASASWYFNTWSSPSAVLCLGLLVALLTLAPDVSAQVTFRVGVSVSWSRLVYAPVQKCSTPIFTLIGLDWSWCVNIVNLDHFHCQAFNFNFKSSVDYQVNCFFVTTKQKLVLTASETAFLLLLFWGLFLSFFFFKGGHTGLGWQMSSSLCSLLLLFFFFFREPTCWA